MSADSIEEIDARISAVRDNLRELVAEATGYAGAADDELISRRIADQEALLEALKDKRAALVRLSG